MPSVRITSGPNKDKIFDLKNTVISIGRDEKATIQVLDQGISRQHSEIFRIGEMCFIRDLHSTNGTFVNNKRITEELLRAGDHLQVGSTAMVFEDKSATSFMRQVQDVKVVGTENDHVGTTVEIRMDRTSQIIPKDKQAGEEVESRHLSLIYELGKLIGGEKDIDAVLQKALEMVAHAVTAEAAYLFLHDRASNKVIPKCTYAYKQGVEQNISRTIMKRVMQTGRPILTSDAAMDDRFSFSESIVMKKIHSALCAPIMFKDTVSGFVYVQGKQGGKAFDREDLELVTSATLQLSMALSQFQVGQETHKGLMGTIKTLVTAMEVADPQDQGHAERVADYSTAVAAEMGLGRPEIQKIRLAALLHDVGKLAVHQTKGSKDVEKAQHVYQGEKILSGIHGLADVLPGVKYHHERADGSGFPYKIKNLDTPTMAKIIIVTNAFDDMCSHGGLGGEGMSVKDVFSYMGKPEQTEFDPKVVQALLIAHRNGTLYNPPSLFE